MLCKWCSGFCQKVCSLLRGFFVSFCWGFFVLVFQLTPPTPFFFLSPTQIASHGGLEGRQPCCEGRRRLNC